MVKKFLILCLLGTLLISPSMTNSLVSNMRISSEKSNEITFYSNYITVTSENRSLLSSITMSIGLAYGGSQYYQITAYLSEYSLVTVKILFSHLNQGTYLEISPDNPHWEGKINFDGCCNSTLNEMTAQFSIESQIPSTSQNEILFTLFFAIYKFPFNQIFIGSEGNFNALGYPYPPRSFIVGLMSLLLGIIPSAIIIRITMLQTRKLKY